MPGTAEQKDALIDRYLNSQLSDVERAAFEIMMIEDTQLFGRVQLLDAFKRSLADESAALKGKRELLALPFRSWLQQPLSLAASVLVAGLGLHVMYDAVTTRESAQGSMGIGAAFVLEATRGANNPVLSGVPPYLFQVDAGLASAGSKVAVSLRDNNGVELLRVAGLQVDANGWARLVFDQPLAGAYTVEVVGLDASATKTFNVTLTE